ncbi:MAG TPA: DUF1254 domain-containing protein [Ignavibacteria bacterium]|nr:DUF1254 domain-containing protein [Ignavibacteria bacterium]
MENNNSKKHSFLSVISGIFSGHGSNDWKADNIYTLAVQAFIYGFPYVYLPTIRHKWIDPVDDSTNSPHLAVNSFWLEKKMTDAKYKDGGSPNNDTFYAIGILDLSDGPVILEHPDMGDRYFTFELADMSSDNFDYIGKRATGSKAGKFLICRKDWIGNVPDGVKKVAECPTPWAFIFGRTLVENAADAETAYEISTQYKLTPLDYFIQNKPFTATNRSVWAPGNPKQDYLAPWKTMVKAMAENPPPEKDNILLKLFSEIGIAPDTEIDKLDEETKKQLIKAEKTGMEILKGAAFGGYGNTRKNSWNSPSKFLGRAGANNEFLLRAAVQCLGGIVANDVQESVYLNTRKDSDENNFSGSNNYFLRFEPDEFPKVNAFWSLTLYGMDFNLADNPINRYSLGDRSPDLKMGDDGSLTIYIQNKSPGPDKESNWLPSPADEFYIVLRCYLPDKEIYEQRWFPPAVKKI